MSNPQPEKVRVVVGDDHPLFREGVVRALSLSGSVNVVGEADDGAAALELIKAHLPDVALLDYRMPGMDGAQVAAAVRSYELPTRVLLISAHDEPAIVYQALQQGAAGFLLKDSTRTEIVKAVLDCAKGRDVVAPSLCLHEFGHAFTAWRFGDHDVAVRGYLTLDPRRYSHPMLSLGLPMLFIALGGIGLPGAAVYVHTWFMTTARRTLVSLAGPTVNLALAMLLLAATRLLFDPIHAVLWAGVAFLAFLQLTALVLNLLPIPGLDGYAALEPHLRPETQRALAPAKQFALVFLLVLFLAPTLNGWFFGVVYWLFDLSGVSHRLAAAGSVLARFWSIWF